jgi:hypothetical protein
MTARAHLYEVIEGGKLRFSVEGLDHGGRTIGVGMRERRVNRARPALPPASPRPCSSSGAGALMIPGAGLG